MAKKLEDMNEKELLIEIAKGQRKESRNGRISAAAILALSAALVISLAIFIPIAANTLGKVYTTLNEAEQVAIGAQKSLGEIDEMVNNFNGVIVDNTDSVNEALSKVKDIDVNSLNRSIKELADILDPLAKLFGKD